MALQRVTGTAHNSNATSDLDDDAAALKYEMHDPEVLFKIPGELVGATKAVPQASAALVVLHALLPDDQMATVSRFCLLLVTASYHLMVVLWPPST